MDGFISSSRIGDTLNYLTVTINPQAPSKAQLEDRFLERDHSVFNPAAVGAKWHDPAGSPWDRSLTCAYGK